MRHFTRPRLLVTLLMVVGCGGGGGATGTDGSLEVIADPDAGATPSGDGGEEGGVTLSHCPAAPDVQGPEMVRVRWENGIAFCIDSTEVTNADYAAFLAAEVAVTDQGARCAWNKAFAPETKSTNGPACPTFDAAARAAYPVVCVDWCDAAAYCRWAGKHLCQKPGGGVVGSITAKDASEWVIACSADGAGTFPYGGVAMPGVCVDKHYPAAMAGLRAVKEAAMCKGGVAGLYDMSGNAWEWHDDCVNAASGDGGEDTCEPLGGSFSEETVNATCTATTPFMRKQVAGDTGFRCCTDAEFFTSQR